MYFLMLNQGRSFLPVLANSVNVYHFVRVLVSVMFCYVMVSLPFSGEVH